MKNIKRNNYEHVVKQIKGISTHIEIPCDLSVKLYKRLQYLIRNQHKCDDGNKKYVKSKMFNLPMTYDETQLFNDAKLHVTPESNDIYDVDDVDDDIYDVDVDDVDGGKRRKTEENGGKRRKTRRNRNINKYNRRKHNRRTRK